MLCFNIRFHEKKLFLLPIFLFYAWHCFTIMILLLLLSFLCCCKTTDVGGCGCLGSSVAGMGFVPVTTVLARVTCVEDVTGRGLSPMNLLGTKVLETEMWWERLVGVAVNSTTSSLTTCKKKKSKKFVKLMVFFLNLYNLNKIQLFAYRSRKK